MLFRSKRRAAALGPPIQMCDALSWNLKLPGLPAELQRLVAHCLAHGRRRFVAVAENFPEACRHVLEQLREVYAYDAKAKASALSPEERLRFHQEHSQPVMEKLQQWLAAQFAGKLVEPNSDWVPRSLTYSNTGTG